jgi:hypothetical protein
VSQDIGIGPTMTGVQAPTSHHRVLAGSSQSEVARTYGVSQSWISRLMARYGVEGDRHVGVIDAATGELIRELIIDPPATTSPPVGHPARPPNAVARTHESWVRAMPRSCDITLSVRQDVNLRPLDPSHEHSS